MRSLFGRLTRHGLLFVLAKSAVLVAPLLAAAILSSNQYGTVEWWLSLSMALGPMVGFGAHALVAYGTVGGSARRHTRTAVVFVLQASAALVLLAVLSPLFGFRWGDSLVGPVSMQCAVVSLQLALSARLKGLGKGAWASLVESVLYVSLLAALLLTLIGFDFVVGFMMMMLVACVGLMFGLFHFVPVPALTRWPRRNYRAFMAAGLRFVAGAMLVGFFMALPRAALGAFAEPEAVGRFALIFRWLSVAIVVHQFINTVFFRQLFGSLSVSERDRPLALTVALVGVLTVGIVFFLSSDLLHSTRIPRPGPADRSVLWLMAAAMVLWSATACLEGCLYRVGRIWIQARAALAGLVVSSIGMAIILVSDMGSVFGFAGAWILGFVAMIATQLHGLRTVGVRLPQLQSAAALTSLALIVIGIL